MSNEILSEIRLELDKFRGDLKDAQKAGEDTGNKAAKSMGDGIEEGLGKAFGGIKGQLLALGASIAGAFTLKESIHAAVEQENAINALNSALAISGQYTDQASKHFQDYASALQKTTIYQDDAIESGGALLIQMGKLSGTTLDRATKASLDLAAALNIDVGTAFNMVGKAATGHTAALAKYGISIKATGDETKDFANALGLLEKRFGGLAEMQANTFGGSLTKTKNMFGELLESIGNVIVKSPMMIAIIKQVGVAFESATKWVEQFANGRDLIQELSLAMIDLGKNLVTFVVAPLELAYNIVNIVFNGIKTAIQAVITDLAKDVETVTGWLAPFSDTFSSIHDAISGFATDSQSVLDGFVNNTKTATDSLFTFNVSEKADAYLQQMQEFTDAVTEPVKTNFAEISKGVTEETGSIFGSFASGFAGAAAKFGGTAENMNKTMVSLGATAFATMGQGFSNAFGAMGAALVKGQNGFAAFGAAMLGVLGDLALQFGSTFILLGIARALTSYGLDPTATGLIAAGIGLSILGGALKAVSGAAGASSAPSTSSASVGSTGGGVAASGGSGSAPQQSQATSFNDTERNDVGTKVTVNVQGNVFDRRETGLQIAEVINETFGSNGITYATGGNA